MPAGHRPLEAQRRTDGDDRLTDPQGRGPTDACRLQRLADPHAARRCRRPRCCRRRSHGPPGRPRAGATRSAPSTTWWFVMTWPRSSRTKPDPVDSPARTCTTLGRIACAAASSVPVAPAGARPEGSSVAMPARTRGRASGPSTTAAPAPASPPDRAETRRSAGSRPPRRSRRGPPVSSRSGRWEPRARASRPQEVGAGGLAEPAPASCPPPGAHGSLANQRSDIAPAPDEEEPAAAR